MFFYLFRSPEVKFLSEPRSASLEAWMRYFLEA